MSGEVISCDDQRLSSSEPGGQREDLEELRKEWGVDRQSSQNPE